MDGGAIPREAVLAPLLVVGAAALVVGTAVVVAPLAGGADGADGPTRSAAADASTDGPPPEYAPDAVVADPIPATGTVSLNRSLRAGGDPKTVVIERSDRVPPERVRQLVRAIVLAGHEVRFRVSRSQGRFPPGTTPLDEDLAAADAYVRIDPSGRLSPGEIRDVRAFTDRGGRLVLLAEPNRIRVDAGPLGASIGTIRTRSVPLAAEYGVVFGNRYLYDTETNDGNFRNVLVRPTGTGPAPAFDRAVLYTATRVAVREGAENATIVARTIPSTALSDGGTACPHPVAVRTDSALMVGDATFLAEGRHNVADNERLIEYVAGFAVGGEQTFVDEDVIVPGTGDGNRTDPRNRTAADAASVTPTDDPGAC